MLQNCTYEVDPLVYGKRQYDVRMREGGFSKIFKGKKTQKPTIPPIDILTY